MGFLIGTDEAGYGPNLGPLVISATVWRVPDELLHHDLYAALATCVAAAERSDGDPRLVIADSKKLYHPGGDLAALELGVLASLQVLGTHVQSWRGLWAALAPEFSTTLEDIPWHNGYDTSVPGAADPALLATIAGQFAHGLRQANVTLTAVRSVALFPECWNNLCDEHGSKGTVLSYGTLALVRDLMATLADEPVLVVCDKHGGRNRYAGLLQHLFPDHFVETRGEGRAASIYRWGTPPRRVEIRFIAKGEQFLPSALASMTSKYLRESAMAAFNTFWIRHVPGLKPTAGYPADARRFKDEIADVQRTLGISDRQLWRNR